MWRPGRDLNARGVVVVLEPVEGGLGPGDGACEGHRMRRKLQTGSDGDSRSKTVVPRGLVGQCAVSRSVFPYRYQKIALQHTFEGIQRLNLEDQAEVGCKTHATTYSSVLNFE